jgi:hypothetical protein
LHRVHPLLADNTGTGNGTEERGVTGGETALADASTRATLAEARLSDFNSMLDDIREDTIGIPSQSDDRKPLGHLKTRRYAAHETALHQHHPHKILNRSAHRLLSAKVQHSHRGNKTAYCRKYSARYCHA